MRSKTPKTGESFGDLYPELSTMWNYEKNGDLKPTDVYPRSHKNVWWKCKYGHEWISPVFIVSRGLLCPYDSCDMARIRKSEKIAKSLEL